MQEKVVKPPFTPSANKSKLPYYLDYRYCRPAQTTAKWLFTHNPLTLEELCSAEVDKLPEPKCWNWSIEEVGYWVEQVLGFPQYRDCFENNYITGRKLILVEASTLPAWNITDFGHIKAITSAVQNLLGIEPEYFARSITLPPRDQQALFLIHKRPTGILQDRKKRTKILQDVHYLLVRPKPPVNLWDRTNYDKPKFPKEMVGLWRVRPNKCRFSSSEEIIEKNMQDLYVKSY